MMKYNKDFINTFNNIDRLLVLIGINIASLS